jgi:hypothetical protein
MEEILKQDQDYQLILEKITIGEQKGWWLSLHNRKTGTCQTLICKNKKIAINAYRDSKTKELLTFVKIQQYCDNWKLQKQKVFKENI